MSVENILNLIILEMFENCLSRCLLMINITDKNTEVGRSVDIEKDFPMFVGIGVIQVCSNAVDNDGDRAYQDGGD